MRRTVETVVVLTTIAILAHYFLVLGVAVPIVITSGSMATRFLGPHRHVICHDCGRPFDVGEEALPSNMLAVCPNCGSSKNELEKCPPRSGNRLLVNRTGFAVRPPRRWEVAVFDCPEKPGELCIKRIVALPGESLQIRDGDLYVNGQILRKPLESLRELAVVVYDDQYRSADQDERWRRSDDGWMNYEHIAPVYGSYMSPTVGPIVDDVSYNQNESRLLVNAHDLMLRCEGQAANSEPLAFRIASAGSVFEVRLDTLAGQGEVFEDGKSIAKFSLPANALQRVSLVEFAVADLQVVFAIDGQVLVEVPIKTPRNFDTYDPKPVGYTVNFACSHSQVLRDVFYTSGFGQLPRLSSPPTYRLGPDEYFVLGDNSPLSEDSRTWASPGVPAKSIVGNVLSKW